MKKLICLLLGLLMLAGCAGGNTAPTDPQPSSQTLPEVTADTTPAPTAPALTADVDITLSDGEITLSTDTATVFTSHDIIYYEDRDTYDSGNPYGDSDKADRHSAAEAAAHTVVNITAPGTYRLSGKLSAGQIRIDLGDNAAEDPNAVVNLILDNVDLTCTVAPAILFLNVYECDGNWSTETAKPNVDTTTAGANLILADGSVNNVNGSYVAKIYKDKDGEKKLWKQDGAIYSYMSMNVLGGGKLKLVAANEGLDSELHLTINGGDISIYAGNDGINTNEDGVSVTTINAGSLHIIAGLDQEGDGIDSNGYLVINGGTVVSAAHPAADAGLDSDLGSFVNGGTVIALGSTMDWAESDSDQVTMNLQFAQYQSSGSAIVVTDMAGTVVFAYDPSTDEVLGEHTRQYMGAVISCGNFHVGQTYQVYLDGTVTGTDKGGVYDVTTITGFEGGILQAFTGTDVNMGPGGMGRPPQMDGQQSPDWMPGQMPDGQQPPEGEMPTMPAGQMLPEGEMPTMPAGQMPPEGEMPTMPAGQMPPEKPDGQMPPGNFGGQRPNQSQTGELQQNTLFCMQDKVNCFSGVAAAK